MRIRRAVLLAALVVTAGTALSAGSWASTSRPGSDYRWAQPGTVLRAPAAQPPAWIPIAAPAVPLFAVVTGYRWAQPATAPVTVPFAQPPVWVAQAVV